MRARFQEGTATLVALFLACGVPGLCRADWSFSWLGRLTGDAWSEGHAVSADGSVVVGESIEGEYHHDYQPEAFRWTQSGGMTGLGFLPGHAWSEAHDVSADGSVVAGYSQASIGEDGSGQAFRWTEDGGMLALGYLPGFYHSWANGVSADGSVVVGLSGGSGGWPGPAGTAFRWTQSGGMADLGWPTDPAGGQWSAASAVSADGSVVVGFWGGYAPIETQRPFRWTAEGGMVDLGGLGTAHDVSADGSVIVGQRYVASKGYEAFRWTEEGGMVGLGGHVPGAFDSKAFGVSEDGSLVVGSSDWSAFLWDATHGMRDLTELLIADGVDLGSGQIPWARDVSFDGQTIVIVGEGVRAGSVREAWIARYVIPEPSSLAALLSLGTAGLAILVCRRCYPGRTGDRLP